MAVHRIKRTSLAGADELEALLLRAMNEEDGIPDPVPDIVLEQGPGDADDVYSRITVIWDTWQRYSMRERSEMIMNAYGKSAGEEAVRRVVIAMGLTTAEAQRMGLSA
jgi:hypothetical protein